MKHLKTFENYMSHLNDFQSPKVEEYFKKIIDEIDEMKWAEMLDEEIFGGNWIDDDWEEDGYDSQFDWYIDHNNNEAEDAVIQSIVTDHTIGLTTDEEVELIEALGEHFGI